MKNFNKNMQRVFKGVIKPKAFFILFSLFFSSLALAAALTVTHDGDSRIPAGDGNCVSSDLGSGTHSLGNDRTENPLDVAFSDDGLKVFTANSHMQSALNLSMNTLSIEFELNAVDTQDELGSNNNGKGCDALDGFDHRDVDGVSAGSALNNIKIVDEGKIFFLLTGQQGATNHNRSGYGSQPAELLKYNLSTPNDFTTASFEIEHDFSNSIGSVAFSRDGTKLFALEDTGDTPNLTTFSLPGPFDISSLTQIHTVDLSSAYDFMNEDGTSDKNALDIEFSDDGSAMFIMMNNDLESGRDESYIYQFRLGSNYDISSASLVGKWNIVFDSTSSGYGMPQGFTFSSDGMKMFIVQIQSGAGVDRIFSYSLECPYGLVECVSNSTSSMGAQVELAKQNITLNVSTIFKRFEWIKRNRDQEKFSSANINFSYSNPLLESLAMSLEPNTKKALETLVSKKEKKEKNSKWSTWSLVDLSISNLDKLGFEKAKTVKSLGLTYGADRKFGNNRFLGWAIRYGDGESNIHQSKQNTELESLTLNLYGIVPTNENRYINAVVGLSALRFNNKYLSKLSGERNGKQAFTSINYRTKNTYGSLNVTPTGKFTYGVTRLSEYTDFISNTINSPTIDIRYAEDTFRSGELTAGFLFDMDKMIYEDGSLQMMGGIEVLYDLTPSIDYKYTYQGETPVNKDTIIGAYSRKSLKTNIGYEWIYLNGFTISPYYERVISLSNNDRIGDAWRKLYNEKFIIKLSKSKEDDSSKFAVNFDPLLDNSTNLNYTKEINGFSFKLNSNYNLFSKISDYGANSELSGTF